MRSWVAATVVVAVLEALLGVGAEKLGNIEVITRGELGKEGLTPPTSSLVLGDGEPRLRVQNDAPPPPISYLPPVQTPLPIEPTGAPGGEIGVAPGGLYEPPVLTPVAAPVQPPPGFYGPPPQESFAGLDNTPVAVGGLGISPVVSTGSAGGYDETYVDTTDDTESGSEGFLSSFRNSKFALIGGVLGAKAAVAQGFKNAKESFVSGITSAVAAKSAAFSSFKTGSSSAQNSYEIGGGDTYGAGQYQGDNDGGKYQGSYEGGQYQGSYGSGQYQGSYGAGEYQGSLGSGQYQGSLGSGQYQGNLGSGQYQGNLGSGQYQGNLGSGQYQGSQGSGQYQGSYGGGEYQGNLGSGSNDGLVGVGGEAVKPVTPVPLPVSPYPIYPPYPQPVYSKPLYSLALYPVAPVYRPNLNPFARIQAKVEGIKAKVEGIAQAKAAAVVGAIAKFEAAKTDLKNKFTSGFQKGFTSFQSNPTKPIYPTYQVNLAKPNYQTYPVKDFPNKQTSPTNLTFPANPTYQTNQSYSTNQNYSTKATNPLSQGGLKVKALPKVRAPFYAIQPVYLYSYGRRPW